MSDECMHGGKSRRIKRGYSDRQATQMRACKFKLSSLTKLCRMHGPSSPSKGLKEGPSN